jgi:hypothetical protein
VVRRERVPAGRRLLRGRTHIEKEDVMKKTILATAVALALSGSLAMAQSDQMPTRHSAHSEHGSKLNKHPGTTTGSMSRLRGNNAELQGNNGNSASGSNSLTNNNNLGNGN